MRFGINTLDDFDFNNKTVLCRVDINEPIDRENECLKDITRIKGCISSLSELSDKGAKVVILAHQGSDIEYKNFCTTRPHARVLSDLLGKDVKFVDDVCGPEARKQITELKSGEFLLLDNVRFVSEEQTLFEQRLKLSHEEQALTSVVSKLAPLADYYVCDAFAASHRDQPSLCGFEHVLPSAMGRLFENEYVTISEMMTAPERPCTFVLGGSKADDAFRMMECVLENGSADRIITGGVVANVLLAAKGYNIGSGSIDYIKNHGFGEKIAEMSKVIEKYGHKIILPDDTAIVKDGARLETEINEVPEDGAIVDIGRKTAEHYYDLIMESKTVFVNGPMGVYENEPTEYGTKKVWDALKNTPAITVLGGGDSITASKKFEAVTAINHISTGGGALIRFLTGEELPVIKALKFAAEHFGK